MGVFRGVASGRTGLTRLWDLKSGSKLAKMDTQNQLEIDAPFPSLFGSILEPKISQNFQKAILEMCISHETSFKK